MIAEVPSDPRHWGPHAWSYFHYLTFAYPDPATPDDKQRYTVFFQAFANSLPCLSCRHHFVHLITQNPPALQSRSDLIVWGIRIHNVVNKRLGKPQKTVDEIVALYQAPRAYETRPDANQNDIPVWPFFVLVATGLWVAQK